MSTNLHIIHYIITVITRRSLTCDNAINESISFFGKTWLTYIVNSSIKPVIACIVQKYLQGYSNSLNTVHTRT